MKFFILLSILLFPFNSKAGSSNVDLHCISSKKSNKLEIKGNIPGDYAEFKLDITQEKTKHTFLSEKESKNTLKNTYSSSITTVSSLENKVWTLDILTKDGYKNLKIFALSETMETKWHKNDAYKATFKAIFIRNYSGESHKQEPLTCTLEQDY